MDEARWQSCDDPRKLVEWLRGRAREPLDLDIHIAACKESLRLAGEVHVVPLLDLDRRWAPTSAPSASTWSGPASWSRSLP
jgi:hypothetical protein